MTTPESHRELEQQLRGTLLKQRLVLLAAGFLTTFAAILLTAVVLSLIAATMILPVWLKLLALTISGVGAGYVFIRYAIVRFLTGSVDSVACVLEKKNPALKGRLIAALQFARMNSTPGYSNDLIQQTVKQALARSDEINFDEAITFYPVVRSLKRFAIAAIAAVAMILLLPGLWSHSLEVYSNPTTVIAPPLGYLLTPVPTSTEWVKYRDIEIGGVLRGDQFPEEAIIHHRLAGGSWQQTVIDLRTLRHHPTDYGDSVLLTTTLRQINKSFDFYVEAGRVKTEVQKVDVVDRPRVEGIRLSIFYPDYTGLTPTVVDENNGSFSAVIGSRAHIKMETNLPIQSSEMIFSDSTRLPMQVTDKTAGAVILVDSSRSYHFYLLDHLGEKNPDPIEYYVTAVPDEYPSIDVLRPGFDVNLNDEMRLPLKVRIFDDYGISSLILKYAVVSQGHPGEEHVAVLHFSERIKTEGEVEFNWDLSPMNLYPGDYLVYSFEVADNDQISGPKITRSRQYVARLPSLEEIIAEAEAETGQRITRTEEILDRGKDLMERLKNAARKISSQQKINSSTDWQQQKELENIAEQNLEMLSDVEKAATEMEKSIDRMSENAHLSRQILEKLTQIQKLFEEVATQDMKDAQERLQQALKELNQQKLAEALRDMEMSQEELLKRLERTLALLKRMQMEQKMESMIRKAEQLAKQQEEMNQRTADSPNEDLAKLSPQEDAIRNALEQLKKETAELRQAQKEAGLEQMEEANKFAEAVEQTDADQNMGEMSKAMKNQQKSNASEQGKQALSKLMEMLDSMQQQMLAMNENQGDMAEKLMRKAIDDANYHSQKQEDLLKRAAELSPQSAVLEQAARAQQELTDACKGLGQRIAELGQVSPFIASELGTLIDDAILNMDGAVEKLELKQGRPAQIMQRESMANLNRASQRLVESLNQQKQCNKGSNCNKGMKKLESMCNKQNSLNQQTQKQCNKPGGSTAGKESSNGLEALRKLAGEQGAIRKSLEQLANEFGNSRQILGRLDDIASEMKTVQEALESGNVGTETTERQLKIYSRMLEASRSLQRKDFSDQRKATSATSQTLFHPPALPAELFDDRVDLEDRLRKYLGDNYPAQYEAQIKAYFKALLQTESRKSIQNQPAPVGQ